MTTPSQFARGYQAALADVMTTMTDACDSADAAYAALQWIADNASGQVSLDALTVLDRVRGLDRLRRDAAPGSL